MESLKEKLQSPAFTMFVLYFVTALFLVLFDTFLATISILITAGGYGCYFLLVQQKLHKKGQERLIATTNRYKIAAEAFGGIKETKVSGKELAFVEQFIPPSIEYSRAMTAQQIIKDLPRYIFETLPRANDHLDRLDFKNKLIIKNSSTYCL